MNAHSPIPETPSDAPQQPAARKRGFFGRTLLFLICIGVLGAGAFFIGRHFFDEQPHSLTPPEQETPPAAAPALMTPLPEPASPLPVPPELEIEISEPIPVAVEQTAETVTLLDVLRLRDRFQDGLSCRAELQKIIRHAWETPQFEEAVQRLTPFCIAQDNPVQRINKIFLSNKKRALIAAYRQEHPQWAAYLKALGNALVAVRPLNPAGETPDMLLHRAHSALEKGEIAQAYRLIQALPPPVRENMSGFALEAQEYLAAENALNQLIAAWPAKGE